jgi:Ca2+/Na+ antiporter
MHTEPCRFPINKLTRRLVKEMGLVLFFSVVVFVIAVKIDVLERLVTITRHYEKWELDEIIAVALFLVIVLAVFSMRCWIEISGANTALLARNGDLQKALIQLKELKGIIPICSGCKKIRDDGGFWHHVESYLEAHTRAEFTHGICPECTNRLYPEYAADKKKRVL